MSLRDQLRGVTPPIVTPFDADGHVDDASLADLLEFVVDGGVGAVFPCGTTGEFASLTADERRQTIEVSVEHAGEVPVLAGVAATNVTEAIANADDAAAAGADAAVLTAPYFHTANAPAGDTAFFEAFAAETPLPFLLYNIPSCTGAAIDPDTVASIADHELCLGIKDSSGDFGYFMRILRETPEDFLVLQGFDSLLLPSLRVGADGGINALSNVVPGVMAELVERADADRASTLQHEAVSPLFEHCLNVGFAPAAKAALTHRGVIPDDAVRPPLVSADDAATAEIGALVDAALSV
ncbi:MAG: dihydrodipicolinate synthase family protein [Halobacteriota archaeon]